MRPQTGVAVLVVLFVAIVAFAQEPDPIPQPYDVEEAYKVYSVLLSHEESYDFAKKTIVIREETVSNEKLNLECISREVSPKYRWALIDYERQNKSGWLLQRNFESEKPYEIAPSATIKSLFDEGGWHAFYERYPGSGGYMVLSAVGFNPDKTLAVVYSGSSCGSLCGSWSFHLLEKVGGKWKEVPGIQCMTVS